MMDDTDTDAPATDTPATEPATPAPSRRIAPSRLIAPSTGAVSDPERDNTRPFGLRILGSPDEPARMTRIRVQILLTGLIVSSNILGAVVVFVLAIFVVPGPRPGDLVRDTLLNVAVGAAYTAVAVTVSLKWGVRRVADHTGWLRSGRVPTESEQRVVLQIPLILTGVQGGIWVVGAALFATFNAVIGDHLAGQIALTVLMGGVLTCANTYVVGELLARPLAARALAGGPPARPQVPGVRARSILAWLLSSAVPIIGLMLVAVATLTRAPVSSTRLAVTVLVLGGVALVFGLRITSVAARANADPIKSLRRAVQQLEAGNLDVSVPIYDGTEIGLLQAGFNRMAEGLRDRERIREVFEHHVGEEVARTALEGDDHLGGEVCDVGVLFVDIIGSTGMASRLAPAEVVGLLNRFFAVVVEVTAKYGGSVNKFEGDGALVVFGAPAAVDDPASAALAAGRALAASLDLHASQFEAGVGISAGPVVAGNIGSPARYEYTVIGDPVNEAARLTDLAKGVKGRVLASWESVQRAGPEERANWSRGREVVLRGRPGRTRVATPRTGSFNNPSSS
jgi:adenylate cyclase